MSEIRILAGANSVWTELSWHNTCAAVDLRGDGPRSEICVENHRHAQKTIDTFSDPSFIASMVVTQGVLLIAPLATAARSRPQTMSPDSRRYRAQQRSSWVVEKDDATNGYDADDFVRGATR